MSKISVVIPVYNEEENIKTFLERTVATINKIKIDYEILFIADPCEDKTEEIIKEHISKNSKIKLIVLSRRFGQPAATMAGIQNITGDRCVIIDCDLQDPPELIFDMNKKIDDGFDVVLTRRKSRKGETIIKKIITKVGYIFIEKITDIKIPKDTGDFRIIDLFSEPFNFDPKLVSDRVNDYPIGYPTKREMILVEKQFVPTSLSRTKLDSLN